MESKSEMIIQLFAWVVWLIHGEQLYSSMIKLITPAIIMFNETALL